MKNENKIPTEAPSKSVQRRIEEQTGQRVPLSAEAAKAHDENELSSSAKDALRPGRKSTPKTPILALVESMSEDAITTALLRYRDAQRSGADTLLNAVTKDLGSKVRIADKARHDNFAGVKTQEDHAKQIARKEYDLALRNARSALDVANAAIEKDCGISRETHRQEFNNIVEPLNTELETKRNQIAADYTSHVTAAINEAKPLIEAARKREEKRKADLKAKQEADAAAVLVANEDGAEASQPLAVAARVAAHLEPKIPASPHFAGASTSGAAAAASA